MDAKKKELLERGRDVADGIAGQGIYGWGNTVSDLCDALEAALAQPAQGEVKFMLDGARFKLSFQQDECPHCGEMLDDYVVRPLDQYREELNGRWVALVPAENDQHLSQPPADTIAVPRSEWDELQRYKSMWASGLTIKSTGEDV